MLEHAFCGSKLPRVNRPAANTAKCPRSVLWEEAPSCVLALTACNNRSRTTFIVSDYNKTHDCLKFITFHVLRKWVGQECKHYHICRQNFKSSFLKQQETGYLIILDLVLMILYEIFTAYQWQPDYQKCVQRKHLAASGKTRTGLFFGLFLKRPRLFQYWNIKSELSILLRF